MYYSLSHKALSNYYFKGSYIVNLNITLQITVQILLTPYYTHSTAFKAGHLFQAPLILAGLVSAIFLFWVFV